MLLRRVQESDTQDRLAAGRDADAVRMYGGDFRNLTPFTQEDAERWYQFEREQPFGWVMEVEGHCVGGARLHQLNLTDRRARFAIGIHAANLRSQGIGSDATRLVLRFAFEQLGYTASICGCLTSTIGRSPATRSAALCVKDLNARAPGAQANG